MIFHGPWAMSQTQYRTSSSNTPPTYIIPEKLCHELEITSVESLIRFSSNGQVYQGHFAGMYDPKGLHSCVEYTKTCIPFTYETPILIGSTDSSDQSFQVIEPGEPGYISPQTSTHLSKIFPQSKTGKSNSSLSQDGQLQNSRSQIENSNKSNSNIATNILESAGSAGLQASGTAMIINQFGAALLDSAQAEAMSAQLELNTSIDLLNETAANTVEQIYQLNQELIKIRSIVPLNIEYQSPQNDLNINIPKLKLHIQNFDRQFQDRVIKTSERINNSPILNSENYYNYKNIGRDAIRSAIESRTVGFTDISDAQLSVAEEVADLLYGIDPFTAIHRGIYEAYTGKNLITGRHLSDLERGLSGASAVLSISTLGIVPGLDRSLKAVSMIVKGGLSKTLSTSREVLTQTREFVKSMTASGVITKAEIKYADKILKNEIKNGALKSPSDAKEIISSAIARGEIKKLPFKTEFIKNPGSPESLRYIENTISTDGIKAKHIYPGNTDEIYIIGRNMKKGVIPYAEGLVKAGFDKNKIHVFDEWDRSIKLERSIDQIADLKKILGRDLNFDELTKTNIFAQNLDFISKAVGQEGSQPTIIDIGRYTSDRLSHFYDGLEKRILWESGRQPWK